jgi:spermidine synthase
MGISFPLLGRLVTPGARAFAESVGSLYAWNTAGAVAGCLVTGYGLIPAAGTQGAICAVAVLSVLGGAAAVIRERPGDRRRWFALAGAGALFLSLVPSRTNILLDVIKRRLAQGSDSARVLFHREEAAGVLTGVGLPQGSLLLINGIVVSGDGLPGHLMAHIPLLMHPDPRRAAVVCFGVGNTFRAAVDHVGAVDAVELMPGVVRSFGDFHPEAEHYFASPGARVFVEDGRHHLLMAREPYDVIVVDASPPIFSAGTVNLYTADFLRLCRRRLAPGGILCLWVPTPCFEEDFWRIAKGFTEVYPRTFAWAKKGMSGVLLMGSEADLDAAFRAAGRRARRRNLGESASWLTRGFLRDALIFRDAEVRRRAAPYGSVTDDRPWTEVPLLNFLRGRPFWMSNEFLLEGGPSDGVAGGTGKL